MSEFPGGEYVVAVALVVFLYRLARTPRNAALWALVSCLLLEFFSVHLDHLATEVAAHGGGRGLPKLATNLMLFAKYLGLGLFFLLAGGEPDLRRRARRELVLLAAMSATVVALMWATPPELRDHSFGGTLERPTVLPIVAFYVLGNLYFVHLLSQGARWGWRYAGESGWRLRVGLAVIAVGLGLGAAASAARAVLMASRWLGGPKVEWVPRVALNLLAASGFLVVVGLLAALLLTGTAQATLWWRQRRDFLALRPLWELLHREFPAAQLDRHVSARRERWQLWRVHHRFWRRYVEIRDGLVQLSPYLEGAGWSHDAPPTEQAAAVREAVRLRRGERQAGEKRAVLIAPPSPAFHDDVGHLLALSRALAHPHHQHPSSEK
ncbi:MAB_1171c family putative transporter [Streptoalloteichus hindustanus]|uniref:DUF6545 domain-containing protein n=1 Tax=Streptoalloteichus hindustanus TaxID=2017 RepID=A0A1M5NZ34_STRHI|nr:MAB_1171c family putative transporter [Streptoalloteichus hindustanus]SHG94834.1 hypothetical protein SAMN05444320_11715 [Streptoalloteichus hindustanus]